jgi:hypothetical protein
MQQQRKRSRGQMDMLRPPLLKKSKAVRGKPIIKQPGSSAEGIQTVSSVSEDSQPIFLPFLPDYHHVATSQVPQDHWSQSKTNAESIDFTYVLPLLDPENVPLHLTEGKVMPAFIPIDQQPEGYTPGGRLLMRDYVCAKKEGWYHLSTREAHCLLHGAARSVAIQHLACAKVLKLLAPVLFPISLCLTIRKWKFQKYSGVELKRSQCEAPNRIPHEHHEDKYRNYYTVEGHWVIPHKLRTALNR